MNDEWYIKAVYGALFFFCLSGFILMLALTGKTIGYFGGFPDKEKVCQCSCADPELSFLTSSGKVGKK